MIRDKYCKDESKVSVKLGNIYSNKFESNLLKLIDNLRSDRNLCFYAYQIYTSKDGDVKTDKTEILNVDLICVCKYLSYIHKTIRYNESGEINQITANIEQEEKDVLKLQVPNVENLVIKLKDKLDNRMDIIERDYRRNNGLGEYYDPSDNSIDYSTSFDESDSLDTNIFVDIS